jgi:hypothetical protein
LGQEPDNGAHHPHEAALVVSDDADVAIGE